MDLPSIFVTVGTTDFDEMIMTLDSQLFLDFIIKCKCKNVVFQIGRGLYIPTFLSEKSKLMNSFKFEYFRFQSSLIPYVASSTLIISHAGAGSISEALEYRKKLLVCINESLMDNHQKELAAALAEKKYCIYTTPKNLCSLLYNDVKFDDLVPYPRPDNDVFPNFLNEYLGFSLDD